MPVKESLILDFLIHASDEDKMKLAQAIVSAANRLRRVRTGGDFEVECWQESEDLLFAAGLPKEDED